MSEFTLVYFNSRGRAEVIRLIFAVANQKFNDVRLSNEDWPEHKKSGKAPFGQLPYLVIKDNSNEHTIAQTFAITSFLGREFKLMGKTDLEQVECEMYSQQITDLFTEFSKVFFEKDAVKKGALLATFTEDLVPRNMTFLEAKLKKTKSGFLIGDGLTIADLFMFVGFETLTNGGFKTTDMDKLSQQFPCIVEHFKRIGSVEQISAWLKARPQTEF